MCTFHFEAYYCGHRMQPARLVTKYCKKDTTCGGGDDQHIGQNELRYGWCADCWRNDPGGNSFREGRPDAEAKEANPASRTGNEQATKAGVKDGRTFRAQIWKDLAGYAERRRERELAQLDAHAAEMKARSHAWYT